MRLKFFFTFLFYILFNSNSFAGDYIQVPALIHVSTFISEGKYSMEEVVDIAKANNFKVVAITDFFLSRVEYGIHPLENVIKRTHGFNSVFKYGIGEYLKLSDEVAKKNPEMVLIPGVEVAPFYYWQGGIFNKDFKLSNWHKHMLVLGLEKASDLEKLPVLENLQALILPFRFKCILKFWPILILLFGIVCLFKRSFDYRDHYGKSLGSYSRPWQIFGAIAIILSLLFLYNNYPYCDFKFTQYQGDLGIKPYQGLIDYVNQKGGLIFWAHPEAEYNEDRGRLKIMTPEHTNDLFLSTNYTGFAIFYEGYKRIGCAGGIWDETLKQYCAGKRNSPVWAIGGLSFDNTGDLNQAIQDLKNILLVRALNKAEVLDALRQGRLYVEVGRNSSQFLIDEFSATCPETGITATMGQALNIKFKTTLRLKGHFLNRQERPFKIQLIKDGSIIKSLETVSSFDITYDDENTAGEGKSYYRLQIQGPDLTVVTNPIFVEPKVRL